MLIVLCVVLSRQDFILNYHNADNIIGGLPLSMTGGQATFSSFTRGHDKSYEGQNTKSQKL
jgi:hypothetical protein